MNEERHWDSIASDYNEEVFDVFNSDKFGRLPLYFEKFANTKHTAIDFGCGTGKGLPYLSPRFKKVLAIDISQKCLDMAAARKYANIDLVRKDLTRNVKFPPADFIFCCNVIILPEIDQNKRMIRNIFKSLKKGGSALVVAPSMDSILFYAWRLIDWYRKEKVDPDKIPASELNYFKGDQKDIFQGIVKIDNVPTKHYTHPELQVLFTEAGFEITAIDKIEYEWTTEFASPPKWMGAPFPWDWLIECRKP
ncbi:MAG: class I SAM-dependent methyltransferase [Flammeovirgaceae bacterium]|nr:class I SAM-dependent methyltransferase [Flammeovirgaceae bacterium]